MVSKLELLVLNQINDHNLIDYIRLELIKSPQYKWSQISNVYLDKTLYKIFNKKVNV